MEIGKLLFFFLVVSLLVAPFLVPVRWWGSNREKHSPEWHEAMRELNIMDGTELPDMDAILQAKAEKEAALKRAEDEIKMFERLYKYKQQNAALIEASTVGQGSTIEYVYEMGCPHPVDVIVTQPPYTELVLEEPPKASYSDCGWNDSGAKTLKVKEVYHPEVKVGYHQIGYENARK